MLSENIVAGDNRQLASNIRSCKDRMSAGCALVVWQPVRFEIDHHLDTFVPVMK